MPFHNDLFGCASHFLIFYVYPLMKLGVLFLDSMREICHAIVNSKKQIGELKKQKMYKTKKTLNYANWRNANYRCNWICTINPLTVPWIDSSQNERSKVVNDHKAQTRRVSGYVVLWFVKIKPTNGNNVK